ncbi:MAG TPA: polysaccharide biosynthesis protein, partial [Candidatus Anaerotruncus excrementipullorum]|nr:polysaccharide biosynthesis protein [Candidatus Anaerotruncus excrementipullorum]
MDKYKRLLSNTLIFAIGTFSSKVLVFLLVPFYTNLLTKGEMGTADLIVQTANLIIPIVSIGMSNAIIRYG